MKISLLKDKKVLKQYETAYDAAEDKNMLMDVCNGDKAQAQKTSVAIGQNAFCFAIRGFKMRLPNGYTMKAMPAATAKQEG